MKPRRLQMDNFLSYRAGSPPLDFRGIHVACISGPNGHGKSSIFDAMTWAIWGKARAKSDDDLIYHGATEMNVDFEFEIAHNIYRVIRKRELHRSKGGKTTGRSDLQFHVWDDDRQVFRPLTKETMRQTSLLIIQTVHMDYSTFTNSAFLRQGRADEFTTRSPAERKEVLANILGLSQYDQLTERAKEEAKQRQNKIDVQRIAIQELEAEVARRAEYEAAVADLERQQGEVQAEIEDLRQRRDSVRTHVQLLQTQKMQLQEAEGKLQRWQNRIKALQRELADLAARQEEFQAILAKETTIRAGLQALTEAEAQWTFWQQKQTSHLQLSNEIGKWQQEIVAAKAKFETEAAEIRRQQQAEAMLMTTRAVAAERLAQAQDILAQLAKKADEKGRLQERLQEISGQLAALRTEDKQWDEKLRKWHREKSLLGDAGQVCPVCRRPLTEEHAATLLADLQQNVETAQARRQAIAAEQRQLNQEKRDLQRQAKTIDKALANRPGWEHTLAQAEAQIQQGAEAAQRAQQLAERLAEIEQTLQAGQYAPAARAQLQTLATQRTALGYDERTHGQVRQQMERLKPFREQAQELDHARQELTHIEATWQDRQARRQEAEEEATQARQSTERLQQFLTGLPAVEKELAVVEQTLQVRESVARRLQMQLGGARQQLQAVEEQRKILALRQKQLARLGEEKTIYDTLTYAFGRKGVQALLIESALPEVEEEANRLLQKMTNGRLSVHLEAQREKKSGGVQETLQIIIADEVGPRQYELYSGGEAFRVNFALRIALSRLLARRAGAQLRSLFIDEGFGTQDSQGRQRLVEAINSIRQEFDHILVITHIEELRDAFPAHIDVRKGTNGSVAIVG